SAAWARPRTSTVAVPGAPLTSTAYGPFPGGAPVLPYAAPRAPTTRIAALAPASGPASGKSESGPGMRASGWPGAAAPGAVISAMSTPTIVSMYTPPGAGGLEDETVWGPWIDGLLNVTTPFGGHGASNFVPSPRKARPPGMQWIVREPWMGGGASG